MATDPRREIFISRRPKKNRNRVVIATGNRDPDTSPKPSLIAPTKVPVLYYLSRNGHIEHPHLIHVPLSSLDGLYLRDVMNTLNYHRGKGMTNMYSWSFKRTYKNGYVWHDVSENDLIEAANGHDYVLKGSELIQAQTPANTNHAGATTEPMGVIRRRNLSWSSFDNPQEYMVVKCESSRELAANFAATQTMEEPRKEHVTVGLGTPPPPSNSSSEEVTGGRYVDQTVSARDGDGAVEDQNDGGGRMKASQVLMQLITCGAPSSKSKIDASRVTVRGKGVQ